MPKFAEYFLSLKGIELLKFLSVLYPLVAVLTYCNILVYDDRSLYYKDKFHFFALNSPHNALLIVC